MTRRQAAGLLLAAGLLAGGRLVREALLVDGAGAWRDPLLLDRFLPPDEPAIAVEADAGPHPGTGRPADGAPFTGTVAVNTAPAESLDLLPGLGPALAARIVADREARGPFRVPADLDRVRGIGPALAGRLAPRLRFATPAPSPAGAPAAPSGPAPPRKGR